MLSVRTQVDFSGLDLSEWAGEMLTQVTFKNMHRDHVISFSFPSKAREQAISAVRKWAATGNLNFTAIYSFTAITRIRAAGSANVVMKMRFSSGRIEWVVSCSDDKGFSSSKHTPDFREAVRQWNKSVLDFHSNYQLIHFPLLR